MINIKERTRELLNTIKKTGFNGVKVKFHDETTDVPEPGEQTVAQKAEFDKNYAIFTVEPQFTFSYEKDEPYVETSYHEEDFWDDFRDMLAAEFGSGVEIKFYKGCKEFEIIQKSKRSKK